MKPQRLGSALGVLFALGGATACSGTAGDDGQTTSDVRGIGGRLATGLDAPTAVATGGRAVFWTDATSVKTCPLTGCDDQGPTVVAQTMNAAPNALAVVNDAVYWVGADTVQLDTGVNRCAVTGCPEGQASIFAPPRNDTEYRILATSPSDVFFAGRFSVAQCPSGGCEAAAVRIAGTVDGKVVGVATDDTGLYWSIAYSELGGTFHCDSGNCSPGAGVLLLNKTGLLAAYGGVVFVEQEGTVYRCAASGCAEGNVVAEGQSGVSSMVADSSGVYWTRADAGTVSMCPSAGCPDGPRVLAMHQANPVSIAVNDHAVLWANAGAADAPNTGSINLLAKNP